MTLHGIHELGATLSPDSIRDQRAGGWNPSLKVVEGANHLRNLATALDPNAVKVMRWWARDPFYSDSFRGWYTGGSIQTSAQHWFAHMKSELDILFGIPGGPVHFEVFNENGDTPGTGGASETLCQWYLELARTVKFHYGDKLQLAVLSLSSGSYNEDRHWNIIVNSLLIPAKNEGIRIALSLHAYSSLIPPVGNRAGLQHSEVRHNIQIDLDNIPPISLNINTPRQEWTGFAPLWVIRYLSQFDLQNTPIIIAEFDVDDMGPLWDGISAGGPHEWARRGMYNGVKRPNEDYETFIGRGLWYSERYWREVNRQGGNVIAVFPFTWSDANRASRWYNDFRHVGPIFNVFKSLATPEEPPDTPPPPQLPDFSGVDYPAAATMKTTPVNVRVGPGTDQEVIGQMSPFQVYRVTYQTTNTKGEIWLRIAYRQNDFYWVCYKLTPTVQITRINVDLDSIPLWRGNMPDNPTTSALGFVLPDTVPVINVQTVMNEWSPQGFRSLHAPGTTAGLISKLLFDPIIWTRVWFQDILDGFVTNVDDPTALINYVANPIRNNELPPGGVPERVGKTLFEYIDYSPLAGSGVLIEGFNPPSLIDAYWDIYLQSEVFRARELRAQGLEILAVNSWTGALQSISLNLAAVLNLLKGHQGALGIRVIASPNGNIDDAIRVRHMIDASGYTDVDIILTNIDVVRRDGMTHEQIGNVLARISTIIEKTPGILAGAVWSLGTNNNDELSDLVDVIKAGNEEEPPDEEEPPEEEEPPMPDEEEQPPPGSAKRLRVRFKDGTATTFNGPSIIDLASVKYAEILD